MRTLFLLVFFSSSVFAQTILNKEEADMTKSLRERVKPNLEQAVKPDAPKYLLEGISLSDRFYFQEVMKKDWDQATPAEKKKFMLLLQKLRRKEKPPINVKFPRPVDPPVVKRPVRGFKLPNQDFQVSSNPLTKKLKRGKQAVVPPRKTFDKEEELNFGSRIRLPKPKMTKRFGSSSGFNSSKFKPDLDINFPSMRGKKFNK